METRTNTETKGRAQTPAELARDIRCDRRQVYLAIQSGALRAFWLGNGWRIFPKDRDEWLETLRSK